MERMQQPSPLRAVEQPKTKEHFFNILRAERLRFGGRTELTSAERSELTRQAIHMAEEAKQKNPGNPVQETKPTIEAKGWLQALAARAEALSAKLPEKLRQMYDNHIRNYEEEERLKAIRRGEMAVAERKRERGDIPEGDEVVEAMKKQLEQNKVQGSEAA
jgi:hypothetical protein